ncbi:MAG TPA: hypothetical protein VFE30_07440 [Anaeromyxobacteraceae bacterium]|jgi:ethanolamine utilization protein EutP (predicted NTPase)|nr:hypothetical protein [Anaeromyxobacteraceae bacterium]
MKRAAAVVLAAVRVMLVVLALGGVARAEDTKMVGVITKIDIAGQEAKVATATLRDVKSDKTVEITVHDDLTLDKFKDHRINEGDEIRCRYEVKKGKNVSTYFRKTAGC